MGVRRVVTGHDGDGKAVFASDTDVEPITVDVAPGMEFHRLWALDETAHFPDDGSPGPEGQYFPPVGGLRFGLFSVPPDSTPLPPDVDIAAAFTQMEERLPGMAAHMEPDSPGMHTTATIDYEVVLSGRVVLELDDGETRELKAGDTVIQNGTRHAWHNPFDEPCLLAVVLVGAHHDNL
jgi:mannose-6-phosphate isomerase-like protein (cupin superfamily)